MFGSWRLLYRLPAIAAVTLGSHAVAFVTRPLRLVAPGLQVRIRNAAFRFWGRASCRVLGGRIVVHGTPPRGRFVLVTNHLSYVDVMLIGSQVGGVFVAKADLAGWPLMGFIFRTTDTIFIDRGRKRDLLRVMEKIDRALARGLGVIFFPEGTTGNGDALLPFKPSLLQYPAAAGHPIHWATIGYRTDDALPPARDVVCWWNDVPFLPHFLRLLALPRFTAVIRFGPEPVRGGDRKDLAGRLRAAMAERFPAV